VHGISRLYATAADCGFVRRTDCHAYEHAHGNAHADAACDTHAHEHIDAYDNTDRNAQRCASGNVLSPAD
jgi:hypothetical protein